MSNSPDSDLPEFATNPRTHPAVHAVSSVAIVAAELGRRIMGQMAMEKENQKDHQVLYCCYPNGDFYTWFIDIQTGHFVLIVLVDEKLKCVAMIPCSETDEFAIKLNQVVNGMNIRHHYPIEEAEDFKPTTHENPPDRENRG